MRDTTVRRVTTRGGHNIPGQVAPGTPKNCRDCEIPLTSQRLRDRPTGTGYHCGRGFCSRCYYQRKRDNHWDDTPSQRKTQWRSAELVAEWEFLRLEHGLNRDQAAERLGVKPSTLTTAAWRLRQYAERDRERLERDRQRAEIAAEVAVAEAEAHRINDDMIAYAIRKAKAA